MKDHFDKIYWFIVGLCLFGAGLSVYAVHLDARHMDIALTFWLSTAVSGGIGYLIGSSLKGKPTDSNGPAINQADNVTVNNSPAPGGDPKTN